MKQAACQWFLTGMGFERWRVKRKKNKKVEQIISAILVSGIYGICTRLCEQCFRLWLVVCCCRTQEEMVLKMDEWIQWWIKPWKGLVEATEWVSRKWALLKFKRSQLCTQARVIWYTQQSLHDFVILWSQKLAQNQANSAIFWGSYSKLLQIFRRFGPSRVMWCHHIRHSAKALIDSCVEHEYS